MARPATGQVVVLKRQRGDVFALRFRANGKRQYVTLGTAEEGWSRARAEEELATNMAQARLGIWKPPAPQSSRRDPSFHEFASEWLRDREPELRPNTRESYRWQLTNHLLPRFAPMPLSEISPRDIDAYKAAKLRGGAIAPNQINKTLGLLGMILKAARRYGYIDRNPVEDVDRLKGTRPRRLTWTPSNSAAYSTPRVRGGPCWRLLPARVYATARSARSTGGT
jgi:hypothetical protein